MKKTLTIEKCYQIDCAKCDGGEEWGRLGDQGGDTTSHFLRILMFGIKSPVKNQLTIRRNRSPEIYELVQFLSENRSKRCQYIDEFVKYRCTTYYDLLLPFCFSKS